MHRRRALIGNTAGPLKELAENLPACFLGAPTSHPAPVSEQPGGAYWVAHRAISAGRRSVPGYAVRALARLGGRRFLRISQTSPVAIKSPTWRLDPAGRRGQ